VVTELGRLGTVQLTDLNSSVGAFQRRYVAEISRIDVMERRLRYMDEQLKKHDVVPQPPPRSEALLDALAQRAAEGQSPAALLADMEVLLEEKERELRTLAGYAASITQDYNTKVEFKHVLDKTRGFAREDPNIPRGAEPAPTAGDAEVQPPQPRAGVQDTDLTIRFRFVAGTILQEDRLPFERMIFRVTRGNSYMRFTEIDEVIVDPSTNQQVQKNVFIIFYQAQYIQDKLHHVCQAFNATLYAIPNMDSSSEVSALLEQTNVDIQERALIARKNKVDLMRLLSDLARHIKTWTLTLKKEKATYHSLNLMMADVSGVLRAEGWVIASQLDQVAATVSRVHRRTSSRSLPNWVTVVPEDQRPPKPPTYFPTNRFTEVYQILIDTYGIPKYQEVNPALFATMTFPFCFGVMFGDVGHGLGLLVFALLVVWKEKEMAKADLGEMGQLIYGGRYLLVFMGIFSTYAGFIYNDCMSLGLALFPVTWQPVPAAAGAEVDYVRAQPPQVYPWGADPTWRIADNELSFFNSYKMKFSVIFGVAHMLVGLCLKASNAIHFHRGKPGPNLDLWFEALPQIAFMLLLFGYMDFLIIYKWALPWGNECDRSWGCQPPSLITTLISMVLTPGTVQDPLFTGQAQVQMVLVLCALFMVPIMLVPKPCILVRRMYARQRKAHAEEGLEEAASDDGHSQGGTSSSELIQRQGHGGAHDEHDEGVGDIVIHQAIETIEFVLGSISNTASYLRLWALSLAHSQLAAVFWERTLLTYLQSTGGAAVIGTYMACAVFFAVTFVVLMLMDNLECFLHALRLHWVEFMNKFFKAEGMKFAPLHFEALFEAELATKKE